MNSKKSTCIWVKWKEKKDRNIVFLRRVNFTMKTLETHPLGLQTIIMTRKLNVLN